MTTTARECLALALDREATRLRYHVDKFTTPERGQDAPSGEELARVAGVVLTMDTIVRDLAARDARRAPQSPDPYPSPPEGREREGGARERSETTRSEPRSRCGRGFCYCAARQRWEDAVRGGRTDDR